MASRDHRASCFSDFSLRGPLLAAPGHRNGIPSEHWPNRQETLQSVRKSYRFDEECTTQSPAPK